MNEPEHVTMARGMEFLGSKSAYDFLRVALDHGVRVQRLPGRSSRFNMNDLRRAARELEAERANFTAA